MVEPGSYVCSCCNERHPGPPLSYRIPLPEYVASIPAVERGARCDIQQEACVVDNEHFFVLGNIEIPLINAEGIFAWTVWTSLSRANFERMGDLWETPGREKEPPYFGWLSNRLDRYPDTLNLPLNVRTGPVGIRPTFEILDTNHPLAVEQRLGIPMARVIEFHESVSHPERRRPNE